VCFLVVLTGNRKGWIDFLILFIDLRFISIIIVYIINVESIRISKYPLQTNMNAKYKLIILLQRIINSKAQIAFWFSELEVRYNEYCVYCDQFASTFPTGTHYWHQILIFNWTVNSLCFYCFQCEGTFGEQLFLLNKHCDVIVLKKMAIYNKHSVSIEIFTLNNELLVYTVLITHQ